MLPTSRDVLLERHTAEDQSPAEVVNHAFEQLLEEVPAVAGCQVLAGSLTHCVADPEVGLLAVEDDMALRELQLALWHELIQSQRPSVAVAHLACLRVCLLEKKSQTSSR